LTFAIVATALFGYRFYANSTASTDFFANASGALRP
jgi:hypothetical protein